MNTCIYSGNVCGTPVISEKEGATKVARYRLAVDTGYTDKDGNRKQAFINCVAFGKCADFVQQHVESGDKLNIIASVVTGDYIDNNGVKHYTTDFVVSQHEFAETKSEKERRKAAKAAATQQPAPAPAVQVQPVAPAPQQYAQPIPVAPINPVPQPVPVAAPAQPVAPVAPVAPAVSAPVVPVPQPVAPVPVAPSAPVTPDFTGFNAFTEFPFN